MFQLKITKIRSLLSADARLYLVYISLVTDVSPILLGAAFFQGSQTVPSSVALPLSSPQEAQGARRFAQEAQGARRLARQRWQQTQVHPSFAWIYYWIFVKIVRPWEVRII